MYSAVKIATVKEEPMAEGTIKKKKAQAFWNWFLENKDSFANGIAPEELRTGLTDVLHAYNENLSFEISPADDGKQQLVISAAGDRDEFASVGRLTGTAPQIDGWRVIAFKPAKGFTDPIEHKGITLDPAQMWFLPLSNETKPDALGLRIAIPGLTEEQIRDATDGAWIVVDNGLGEKTSGDEIQHIEVVPLPEDPKKLGYVVLNEIEPFISWRREHKCEDGANQKKGPTIH
jgi:hypothetical protein